MWRRLSIAAFALVPLLVSSTPSPEEQATLADVVVLQAWYGDPATTGADVTGMVKAAFARGPQLRVDPSVFSDTAVNHHKLLWLKYRLRGKERILYIPDEQTRPFSALLDEPPASGTFDLVSATYQGTDVSAQVKGLLSQGVASIPVSCAALGVDHPREDSEKKLSLTFRLKDGDSTVLSGTEGQNISLRPIAPMKELPALANGTFESNETDSFRSEQTFVPAAENVLSKQGTFTISDGLLRPFPLDSSIRADFREHTGRAGSKAMWINPIPGRQPVLLWQQKVAVQPHRGYLFSCQVADISDSDSLFGTIVLEVNGVRSKPFVLEDVFRWHSLSLPIQIESEKSVRLKIWRDVLPYNATGPAALGLDDIHFGPG